MKKLLLAAALGGTTIAGSVAAQPAPGAPPPPRPERPMADGVLTAAEAAAQADRRFDRLDFNRDGRISEETFAAAGPAGPRGKHWGRRGRGPGRMARADAPPPPPPPAAVAGAPRPDPRAMIAQRFRTLDRNNDGQLTREEFRAQATDRFARMDTNRDGKVDAAERFASREKMREQRRGQVPPPPAPRG